MDYYRQIPGLDSNQIFDTKYGDVNGDSIVDTVYIIGQKPVDSKIRYTQNIRIVIQDGKTKQFHYIDLKTNSGYNPRISLEKFSKSNTYQIFISIDSGGSGGYGYFYIYSFLNNKENKLFDYDEFSNRYHYTVKYIQDYKIEIINKELNKRFLIDIKNKGVNYLSLIYNPDGTLKEPKNGDVLALNDLYPIDRDRDGIMELMALQRIIGLYNADTLGNVETLLKLQNNKFVIVDNEQNISTNAYEE